MTIRCTNCGFDNPPGMRFCGNCGTRLVEAYPEPQPGSSTAQLFDRYRKAGSEAAGQRRNVTVLFADLSGYTALAEQLDSEDVYFIIQEYLKLLADTVYRYDGFVDKYTGDGLMALFGAPISQENNAELAVRAATDMQSALARLSAHMPGRIRYDLYMRIGLNSGSVVVGNVGSDLQMNYTAIGDTVNLASRMEQAARPGTILVSESVYQQTRAMFDFTRLPPQSYKGISRQVNTYQVVGIRENPEPVRGLEGLRSPMIGRDSELARLRQALDGLAYQKHGGLAIITGEAGLGKSRLVSELVAIAPLGRVQVAEGHSLTYRRTVSYWIFLDMLRQLLAAPAGTPEAEVQRHLAERLQRLMGDRAGEVQTLLERALSLRPSNPALDDRLSQLEAGQLRQRIFLAFRDWLVAEAQTLPLLLVLEDLHWADDASLDLLQFLVETTREEPILILAVSRPFEEGPLRRVQDWAEKRLGKQFAALPLQTLSPAQSEKLLNNLLALTLPESLRQEILQRAAGNPFYLEEILRMLIDQGVIRRERGQLQLVPGADLTSLGVPETLKGLILSRFDRLEAVQRQCLQVAAAIGRRFDLELLRQVVTLTDDTLAEAIVVLVEREFILPLPEAQAKEFEFQHVLVSDAVYSTLLARYRAELHGRIGAAIEQLYADHLDEQVELLARHYAWSNRRDRALHYLILAGRKAAITYLNQQAFQYYEEALELLPEVDHPPAQALQVHTGMGDVLLFLGDYARSREHYQSALALVERVELSQQVQQRSGLQRQLGTTYERQGDYEQALQYLHQSLNALTGGQSRYPVERARVLNDIGWIHFRRGQLEDAENYLQRALESVDPSSQPGVIASIYNRLGGVYYVKDDLETASSYARKSLELRREIGDIAGVARTYNNLGLLEWRLGSWDAALNDFNRSVELQSALNDVEGIVDLHYNIGLLLTDKGSLVDAREHLEEALQTAQQVGHMYLEAVGYQHLSYYWLVQKDWSRALEYGQRSMGIFKELDSQENFIDAHVTVGIAWLNLGNIELAEESCHTIENVLDSSKGQERGPLLQKGRALRLAASIAQAHADFDQAARLYRQSAEQFTALDNQLELGRTLADLAWLARQEADMGLAANYAGQARTIFRRLGAQLDLQAIDEAGFR